MHYFSLQKFIYSKSFSFLGLILFRIFLDICYEYIVSPVWGYQGYVNNFSEFNNYISWLFLILLSPLIVKTFIKGNVSSNILSVLVIVSLVPTTSFIAFNSEFEFNYILLNFIYWTLLLFLNQYIPDLNLNRKTKNNSILFPFIIILLVFTVIFISGIYTGFRFHFGIFDVYDLRVEARGYKVPLLFGYIGTAANTILPIIFVYFIIKRKKIYAILIAFVIVLNFGIAGGKSVMLLLFIAIIGYLFIKKLDNSRFFIWGGLLLIIASIIEFKVFGTYFISFFSTYRLMFLTSMINYRYYEFFSTREFDYFRQSLLKWTDFKSPYEDNIAFLIGYMMEGSWGGRANNGLFSDAYSNFGPLGMFVFPFFLVIILKFIEESTKGFDERLLFIVTVATSASLLSLTFSTALMTGGLFLMIIFFYTFPRFNNIS